MPGLPLRIGLTLHDCLIYQLDRKLNCHRSKASVLRDELSKWMDKWTEQARQLKKLKKEKLELSVALLEKLEAMKKGMEDASGLRDIILEAVDDRFAPVMGGAKH